MENHKWKYTAIYISLYGISCPDIEELTLPSYRVISIGQYAGKYKNITLILSIKTAAEKYNVCSPFHRFNCLPAYWESQVSLVPTSCLKADYYLENLSKGDYQKNNKLLTR